MRILLVEPDYHRTSQYKRRKALKLRSNSKSGQASAIDDETLWYPPLGLLKLARLHMNRDDEVTFVCGQLDGGSQQLLNLDNWDRIYISTLFTYHFDNVIKTIFYYRNLVGGTARKIFVGGIMASLIPDEVFEEAGILPITGILHSPSQIHLNGETDIDLLTPAYEILDPFLYAINETYYAYTSRGCTYSCSWCGVPTIEPHFDPYIDIKAVIQNSRSLYGDKPVLKLMDNNVLASPFLDRICEDLYNLGYGNRNYTNSGTPKQRVVDFNQGIDADHINDEVLSVLADVNISPMRIAFDRIIEQEKYVKALDLSVQYGFTKFSNYMLYNWRDTPCDLYDRIMVNIELNEEWRSSKDQRISVYSYPMRFAPIAPINGEDAYKHRDFFFEHNTDNQKVDLINEPSWNPRFVRNIEIMKGAANGAISPTPTLARRTVGRTFEEYLTNLYMPEVLLRNRNRYEKTMYKGEPTRLPGSGEIEAFRSFLLKLLSRGDSLTWEFHQAVSKNRRSAIRSYLSKCKDASTRKWLEYYLT